MSPPSRPAARFAKITRRALVAAVVAFLPSTVAAQPQATARIVVDASRVEAEISPLLYGQFAEFMFEGVKGGLHAELLRNRGFEEAANAIGLSRYWERYPDDRNDDYGLSFGWMSPGFPTAPAASGSEREWPPHALHVTVGNGVIERRGVFQSRIPVRPGVAYHVSAWMSAKAYAGAVVAALEEDVSGGRTYAESALRATGDSVGEWRRWEATLRPGTGDPLARFALLFPGQGTLYVDQLSLMPGDATGGVRADVEARIAALEPAFFRWPGGNVAQDYHWQWGVGPRDTRPTWVNLSWRNEPEPSDFGTNEYLALCRRVGAEPTLTVNVEGRGATPEEAAAWVEYVNGPATSRWGARRAADGHPEPWGVRYWEVGNEIWGSWVRGHSDAATYARNLRRYVAAMKAVDPSIRIIAVGDNDMAWNRTVLREAGSVIDYLAIHHYYGHDSTQRDRRNLMARPLYYERFYREVDALARALVPGRTIRLAINEWGLALPEARQHAIESALHGARLMNVLERSAPVVAMSAVSDVVNGWPGGVIQASRHGVFVTPLYHANALWASHVGTQRLRTSVAGPTFDSGSEGRAVPVLDVVASRSADGTRVFLKIVNTDSARAIDASIELRGATPAPAADWDVLAPEDWAARNTFATPDAVAPRRERVSVAARRFTVRVPAHSASVLTLHVGR